VPPATREGKPAASISRRLADAAGAVKPIATSRSSPVQVHNFLAIRKSSAVFQLALLVG